MAETVELSTQEVADLRSARDFLNELGNDKDLGFSIKEKAAKKFNIKHPDLVAREQIEETLVKPLRSELDEEKKNFKSLEDKFTKFQNEHLNAKEEVALEKKLRTAQSQYGLTDDGLNKAIERMKAEGHTDIDAAASWVVRQEPKVKPVSSPNFMPSSLNLYGSNQADDQWKELNLNPSAYADKEIMNILSNPEEYREFGGTL